MPKETKAWKDSSGRLYDNFEAAHRAEATSTFHAELCHYGSRRRDLRASELISLIANDPHPAKDALDKYIAAYRKWEPAP